MIANHCFHDQVVEEGVFGDGIRVESAGSWVAYGVFFQSPSVFLIFQRSHLILLDLCN